MSKTSMGMTLKQRLICSNKGKSQVKSVHQSCFHEPLHNQEFSKLNFREVDYKILQSQKVNTAKFCSLKKWTLAKFCSLKKRTPQTFVVLKRGHLQTFVVSKSGPYKLLQSQKADTTNFCSLKKRTLQTFVVSKSGHYKLCQ